MEAFASRRLIAVSSFLLSALLPAAAQQLRPPAVPLITHNPYFSVWSMGDKLTGGPTRHWTGAEQPFTGLLRIDGKPFRYMGGWPGDVPAMEQQSVTVGATNTTYVFTGGGVKLTLDFFTPAFPQDIDLLSRPVTYLTWTLDSTDNSSHKVELLLDVDGRIAVDTDNQKVTWGRSDTTNLHVLNIGSRDQQVLNRSGDNLRIDWGYFHLAVPNDEAATLAASREAIHDFVHTGMLPTSDDMDMPATPRDDAAQLAVELPIDVPVSGSASRHVLVSYTEDYAIEYLGRKQRPYWQRNNKPVQEMLTEAEQQYSELMDRGAKYDADLAADLEKAGGPGYRDVALLAYRQTLAAHGLSADIDGKPRLYAKENFSDGDIATVDVIYPTAPFFLFFNPELLEAELKPVFDYAELPRWRFPFAPHDLGFYPLADGQVYGGGEQTEENQMPVEETGNLLILAAALGQTEGNWHVAKEYWPLFTKWAEYLKDKGLDPENQLSTDDFAGHLAHNANLSIKAIDALAAYAQMARGIGDPVTAKKYEVMTRGMATKWEQLARDGDHYKLAFDRPDTWSQKYNLVWDQILGFHIFPNSVRQTEMAFYLKHINEYGLPLDSRADYTKLDWQVWTATLADKREDFDAIMAPIQKWVSATPSRVPLTDWYDTKTGEKSGFQARSVVGGVYIKALADKSLAEKWRTVDTKTAQSSN
ncbi:glutaminase family protein [Silvibacterium dinghuense]|uniref:DUF4965 domain-containing protein n=1 Tax=Silvibacterium dinghuense TaxID=1560006 RepID=A0A4Q1SIP3_9BACT|nr:glutaminase family protein [Silvibacterium dinghuense]RXS97476.1 DUF4965 domain-containing protein [Silvibacterium dinghuense]GGG99346.1 hypothetical protein GCM10011586_13570 [Silvibacterium dinghuense]